MELSTLMSAQADAEQAEAEAEAAKKLALQRQSYKALCHSAFLNALVKKGEAERAKQPKDQQRAFRPYDPAKKSSVSDMAEALTSLGVDPQSIADSAPTFEEHQEYLELAEKYPDTKQTYVRLHRGESEFTHHANVLAGMRSHDQAMKRALGQ